VVVNPIDVPTTNKERKNRRDAVDARKLARSLRNRELQPIYVPDDAAEADRMLVRGRKDIVRKTTRIKNQIKAFLRYLNIRQPDHLARSRWSGKYINWLRGLSFEHQAAREHLNSLLDELQFYSAQLKTRDEQIKRLCSEEKYKGNFKLLRTVPGIGPTSAMIFLTEIIDIHRFASCRELAAYAGLVPDQQSSGDTEGAAELTCRRNPHLRGVLIECAWTAMRKDPALTLAYQNLRKGMRAQLAIVRIARKLLNRIRYVLVHQEPYVIGVVQ
jgi:transposase